MKSVDVQIDRRRTGRPTDGWSDGQTDDGEVIPTQKVVGESDFHFFISVCTKCDPSCVETYMYKMILIFNDVKVCLYISHFLLI